MFVSRVGVIGDQALADAVAKAGFTVLAEEELGSADLVLEAGTESVFSDLDERTPSHAILAATSARAGVTELGDVTTRPDQVVGLHLVAGTRLVEVVEGDDTSDATAQTAAAFAQAIRRQPVRCAESPGLIVARVVLAAAGAEGADELFDAEALARARADDELAHLLAEAHGHRTAPASPAGGEGRGHPVSPAELLALAEACALLEEGVAGIRDIDVALATGAGMSPGPFARADQQGLDAVLAEMHESGNEALTPPTVLRRLVAQGRLGAAAGQGFFAYPLSGDEGAVRFELRGGVGIAWLANPPANSISAEVVAGLREVWTRVQEEDVRALVLASAGPALFCAGADIRAFASMEDPAALLDDVHGLLRDWERSRVVTVAAVNGLALGGGCELAMACDVRIASSSATFGQPEINLGIVPGFGGTQRLPRLVGPAKALEMNLSGEAISADDAYEHGLVNRVVSDHELFDTALRWARGLSAQAPVAIEQIKRASTAASLDAGVEAEKAAFAVAFGSEDGREGVGAFIEKRKPRWKGR